MFPKLDQLMMDIGVASTLFSLHCLNVALAMGYDASKHGHLLSVGLAPWEGDYPRKPTADLLALCTLHKSEAIAVDDHGVVNAASTASLMLTSWADSRLQGA
ncbi:hypothetical protein BC940DRAFT_314572 [Gongronella butleri]|nr:hypothetical protein BC940DRAFT_314572 [Gongronella butleri]